MKKYFSIGKINFLNNIQYSGEFFFKAIFIVLILFIFTNIWKAAYAGQAVVAGFTITMMIWYLLMTESIVTSSPSLVKDVNKEIQSGEIAYQLNKPYGYISYHLAKVMSYRLIGFITTFVIGSFLVFFLVGGLDNFKPILIPFLVITILLALILDFFMIMCLALLAFWLEDTTSFKWIYDKIVFTLGGMLIPLEIFPKWLASISYVMPFSFVAYHPAKLFVNFDLMSFFNVVGMQISYAIIFGVLALMIYKMGIRRVNINGG